MFDIAFDRTSRVQGDVIRRAFLSLMFGRNKGRKH
jgi:hypothetical protein